jgi:hypothetical protein
MVSRKCGAGLSGSNDVLGESPVPDSKDILKYGSKRANLYYKGLLGYLPTD